MKKQMEIKKNVEENKKDVSPKRTDIPNSTNPADDVFKRIFQENQDFLMLKLSDLKIEKKIGSGASADVFKGVYKELDVAIKKLRFG